MAERVGTEKGRKNFRKEASDAMQNTRDAINLANDYRYGPFRHKTDPKEQKNIDSIALQAIKRSKDLDEARYEEAVARKRTEDRASGSLAGSGRGYVNPPEVKMKNGGKVRGCGAATKGHGKGTMR
jgi:hypothetical protein